MGKEYGATEQAITAPLIAHWDGKNWEKIQGPAVEQGAYAPHISSIAATSPTDIWAVGHYMVPSPGRGYDADWLLILHWDGARWSRVSTEDIPGLEYNPTARPNSTLESVSASSADNVWAEGMGATGRLLMHWDGKAWSVVQRSGLENIYLLRTLVAAAKDDVWLFGEDNGKIQAAHSQKEGKGWTLTSIPVRGASGGPIRITAAVARASDDVWAFGSDYIFREGPRGDRLLVAAHWNGAEWSAQAINVVGTDRWAEVRAATIAGDDLWTAGYPFLRYTAGPCPERTSPAPTPTPASIPDPGQPEQLPGTGSRLFRETGMTVTGVFLDYWQAHGGLAQQGYPVSETLVEISPTDGKAYTVQYFERAVFEYHPENLPPYDVLLSQLGTFEYKKRYSKGAPNQQRNMGRGSLYFPETGKWLGGEFLAYWQANGGLAQQGYPITDEFTEASALNGQQYRVQYFERAVFELHPENAVPHNVLLAQLGRFRYDELHGQARAGSPPPPSDQLVARNVLGRVVANDRYLYWIANTPPNFPVYGFDIQENRSFLIADAGGYKYDLACDNNVLAWVEMNKGAYPPVSGSAVPVRIMKYDPAKERVSIVREGRGSDQLAEGRAAVQDGLLYYNEGRGRIRAQSLTTDQEYSILADARDPVVSGDVMLWSRQLPECLAGDGKPLCTGAQELYLTKGFEDTLLAKIQGQFTFEQYAVHNDKVVWTNSPIWGSGAPPLLYSISTGTTITMSQQLARFPVVRDDLILWGSAPGAGKDWSIDRYYPGSGAITVLLQSATPMYPQAFIGREALAYIAGGESPKAGYRTAGDLYVLRLGP
jgi:hypothetical protein